MRFLSVRQFKVVAANEDRFRRFARESFSWEYLGGGSHYLEQHGELRNRLLPFLVVVCTLKGDYICRVDGEEEHHVRDHEVLLVPPMVRHTVLVPAQSLLSAAHFRFCFFRNADLLRYFEIPRIVRGKTARQIARIIGEITVTMRHPGQGIEAVRQSVLAHHCAITLLKAVLDVSMPRPDMGDLCSIERLGPVLTFIEENLARPIMHAELAAQLSLSEVQFYRVFTRLMKIPPMEYIRNVRLRKAQLLLLQTGESVGRIGEQVGYPDIFHFSKIFKHTFGMSPLSYRKQMRQWT